MNRGALAGRHIAVVGGGLAGLAAALECADLGGRVTLIERQRRLGGLTWSFERNGIWMDNGQHVFLSCCDAYQRFVERIGGSSDVVAPRPLDIPVLAPAAKGPVAGRLRRRDLPVPFHLASSLLGFPHIRWPARLGLGRALAGLARLDLDDPALDQVTFAEWLSRRGQSPEAIEAVWDLITIPTVNLPAAEASLAAAAKVFKTGVLGSRSAADMGWSRVPLGRLHGDRGAAALATAGVDVRTGTRVDHLSAASAGWDVRFGGDGLLVDGVVVALPHEEAADVVPQGAVASPARWAALGSSSVIDIHLVFDRRVTNRQVMAAVRSDVQWVFDRTVASGLAESRPSGQYLAVSLSAADRLLAARPDELIQSTVKALSDLLPEVRGAHLVDSVVTKERRATFRAAPGSARLRPPARTRLNSLALAGAWTATGWPATMEGAVRSGIEAARVLAAEVTDPAVANPTAAIQNPITQEVA